MNDLLDIEIILKRKNYGIIYKTSLILFIIILIFIYIINVYSYETYYLSKGKMVDNTLELIVNTKDLKYFNNNYQIEIENQIYNYKIISISNELYIDESYNNYKHVYLKINNLSNVDNYAYEIKLKKENKKIVKYLFDYI